MPASSGGGSAKMSRATSFNSARGSVEASPGTIDADAAVRSGPGGNGGGASPGGAFAESPHATQGAPGHVVKIVTRLETSSAGMGTSVSHPNPSAMRASLSVVNGFAAATSGALERMRASRDAPETPVKRPSPKRRVDVDVEGDDVDVDVERDAADALAAISEQSPARHVEVVVEEATGAPGGEGANEPEPYYASDDEEGIRDRAEMELSLQQRMSPLSPLSPPSMDDSPAFIAASPSMHADSRRDALRRSDAPTPADASDSPEYEAGSFEAAHLATEGGGGHRGVTFAATPEGVTFAATPEDIRVSVEEAKNVAAAEGDSWRDGTPQPASPKSPNGGGGWSAKKPPVVGGATNARDANFAAAVKARQQINAHGALFASIGSPLGVAYPPGGMKHTPSKGFAGNGGARGANDGDGAKVTPAGKMRKSVPSSVSASRVMSPLPISRSVLERIDALGPEMQPMQKYILLAGILLDFYAKTQLVRELSRFATQADWTWFSMVFIFFLLSGCCTTAYWLLHYPMPSKQDIEKYGKQHPRVFGFNKFDFKRMVRNAGALCAMCQLGTAFAAWRALRTNDLRQRKAEMDLRGMQLVDAVFLTLPVATLQAYIGMACSSPDIVCPGRDGFDVLLFLAVCGAVTSATLCFISLDLHEKPPSFSWRQYWAAHKAHLSEMAAKGVFRFLELAARITSIALFAAATGGWVFAIFFLHAFIVFFALWKWPKIFGGGVPNRHVWEKVVATKEVAMPKWFPERLKTIRMPLLDDSKLLAATLAWPPSCFVANATDKHGKFWWRSKTCPRKSFMSLDRADAIFPLPAVIAVQVFEAMLMLLIVGAVIRKYPHYQSYYVCTVLVNLAWLMSAIGWMSAASIWNPFLPEGPPLGLPTGMASGSWIPGTAKKTPGKERGKANADEKEGWSATGECGENGGCVAAARGGVAVSVGGDLFSPSPGAHLSGRHVAMGRTPGRPTHGGGHAPAAGCVTDERASYSAGDPGVVTPENGRGAGVGATTMSATPYTGYKGAGGHVSGRGTAGINRRGEAGHGGGSAHGPHRDDDAHHQGGDRATAAVTQNETGASGSPDNVAQALNFQSVPEDFKYDYAAHAAAVVREQERAAELAAAAAARVHHAGGPGHRRTDSGESAASAVSHGLGGGHHGVTGATPCLASPAYDHEPVVATMKPRLAGGAGAGAGGFLHHSTTSTVSSVATPPFPGRTAGMKSVRTSAVSTTSTEISHAVNATLSEAVNDLECEGDSMSPLKGGESPQRVSRNGRYSASSPLSEVNR